MKFFIDTANIDEIKEAHAMGILDGVTTNPSLMAKVGIQGKEAVHNHYKKICEVVSGPVSAEVIATDFENLTFHFIEYFGKNSFKYSGENSYDC